MPAAKHPTCHPYARISDPTQRKGGGLERQTKADADEFCRRFGFILSKRIRVDDGVSAFKGLNATPGHELGKFLLDAKRGTVSAEDCLLVENWDRLTRQGPWAAVALANDLREMKIHLGRLDRMKLLRHDSTDPGDFFDYAIESMRGHSESAAKSMRNGAAWQRKREAARQAGKVATRRLPAWIEECDGELHLLPGPTAALRRLFELAALYGQLGVARKLIEEGVKPFGQRTAGRKGEPGRWPRSYVAKLLKDRRVLGEYQPRKRDGSKAGDVIPDYYPAAITPDQWNAVRAAVGSRKELGHGPAGEHVNVFVGLLRDARTGESYFCASNVCAPSTRHRVLKSSAALQGKGKSSSFPFATFERAVLGQLREIDPHEILNGDDAPDETAALSHDLNAVEAELAEAAAFLDKHGFSATIGRRVALLEARQAEVAGLLAEARERAKHPLSETWGEAQSLVSLIENAPDPDDARLRLRAALRRIVDRIMLLVVPRGADRLAAVQIWFAGGQRHRDYLILHRPAKANGKGRTEGGWWVHSFADALGPADYDLRRRAGAEQLEQDLAALDLSDLA
jgi:DNA invertase Pin-like site-specific DNA recombinase